MPASARPDLDPDEVAAQCRATFTRRSGPGGQNRNKVETAVVLTHGPTGLTAEANEKRSQAANRAEALFRLRLRMAIENRQPATPGQPPSPLWVSRCRGGRIPIRPDHDDFPFILAEMLDVIDAHALDIRPAAADLGCSATQLVKLLRLEPRALVSLNQRREARGLGRLR